MHPSLSTPAAACRPVTPPPTTPQHLSSRRRPGTAPLRSRFNRGPLPHPRAGSPRTATRRCPMSCRPAAHHPATLSRRRRPYPAQPSSLLLPRPAPASPRWSAPVRPAPAPGQRRLPFLPGPLARGHRLPSPRAVAEVTPQSQTAACSAESPCVVTWQPAARAPAVVPAAAGYRLRRRPQTETGAGPAPS